MTDVYTCLVLMPAGSRGVFPYLLSNRPSYNLNRNRNRIPDQIPYLFRSNNHTLIQSVTSASPDKRKTRISPGRWPMLLQPISDSSDMLALAIQTYQWQEQWSRARNQTQREIRFVKLFPRKFEISKKIINRPHRAAASWNRIYFLERPVYYNSSKHSANETQGNSVRIEYGWTCIRLMSVLPKNVYDYESIVEQFEW